MKGNYHNEKYIKSFENNHLNKKTSTTSLVAYNHLTKQELEKLKENNSKIINDIKLEWIIPQEKPFKQSDNKYYFIIWRSDKNDDWRIIKLIHNKLKIGKIFNKYN